MTSMVSGSTRRKLNRWAKMSSVQILDVPWVMGYHLDNFRPDGSDLLRAIQRLVLLSQVQWAGSDVDFENDEFVVAEIHRGVQFLSPTSMGQLFGEWLDILFLADTDKPGVVEDRMRVVYVYRRELLRSNFLHGGDNTLT